MLGPTARSDWDERQHTCSGCVRKACQRWASRGGQAERIRPDGRRAVAQLLSFRTGTSAALVRFRSCRGSSVPHAVQLLVAREPRAKRWTGAHAFWEEFIELVASCGFPYLKMDLFELDMMHTGGITEPVTPGALVRHRQPRGPGRLRRPHSLRRYGLRRWDHGARIPMRPTCALA